MPFCQNKIPQPRLPKPYQSLKHRSPHLMDPLITMKCQVIQIHPQKIQSWGQLWGVLQKLTNLRVSKLKMHRDREQFLNIVNRQMPVRRHLNVAKAKKKVNNLGLVVKITRRVQFEPRAKPMPFRILPCIVVRTNRDKPCRWVWVRMTTQRVWKRVEGGNHAANQVFQREKSGPKRLPPKIKAKEAQPSKLVAKMAAARYSDNNI